VADISAFARLLDFERADDATFVVPAQGDAEGFYPAGTIAAIAACAAIRCGAGQDIRSLHLAFVGAASPARPLTAGLSVLRSGRQLTAVSASVTQEGRLCAHGYALLGPRTADLISHQAADAADVPGPSASAPAAAGNYAEVRVVGGTDPFDPELVAPPRWDTWVAAEGLPARPGLMEALIAFEANAFVVSAAVLPHRGLSMHSAHNDLMAVITATDVVFHAAAGELSWLRFSQESTYAGGGWIYGRGLVFGPDGRLLASFGQEAMLRNLPPGRSRGMLTRAGAAGGLSSTGPGTGPATRCGTAGRASRRTRAVPRARRR
jgi:acyl-CoA thioesterase